nr:hypothetical protein [Rickettsia endosymbiont of Ceutorhynchus assimilis]
MNRFGHSLSSSSRRPVQIIRPQPALPTTTDGDYNVENHRLCNIGMPSDDNDASTKKYVDLASTSLYNKLLIANEALGALGEAVDNMSDQVKSSMNRIQELDQILNRNVHDDLRGLSDLARETGEKMSQLAMTCEERFQKMEQIETTINHRIDQIEHT